MKFEVILINIKALLKMTVMESVPESVFGKFGLFSVNFSDFARNVGNEVFNGACF